MLSASLLQRPIAATDQQTMRAVQFKAFGPPSVLEVAEIPKPQLSKKGGELLVCVHATSVNQIDVKCRRGDIPPSLAVLPKVPGGDVAGVVEAASPGCHIAASTRVAFLSEGYRWDRPLGSYAEFVTVPEEQVAVLPDDISFEVAAALPMAALTAQQAFDPLKLKKYQRVLIHAGAGGVGSAAIQIAKARGLHVTTTCSAANIPFVRQELGADVAIDYTAERFEEVCQKAPFDCILDLVGGDYEPRSKMVLKKWGTYVSVLADGNMWSVLKGVAWDIGPGPRYRVVSAKPSGYQMAEALRLVQQSKLKPVIDRVLPLEQAREAHEYMEKGHARGKVVLKVRD